MDRNSKKRKKTAAFSADINNLLGETEQPQIQIAAESGISNDRINRLKGGHAAVKEQDIAALDLKYPGFRDTYNSELIKQPDEASDVTEELAELRVMIKSLLEHSMSEKKFQEVTEAKLKIIELLLEKKSED